MDEWNSCLIEIENMDRKPAAQFDPMKDTPSLKEPITKSYLGKILRQSEIEPTDMIPVDMRPVVTEYLAVTDNPFDTETLTENPIVTELNDALGMGSSDNSPRSSLPNHIEFRDDWIFC